MPTTKQDERVVRAQRSLQGLSVGDAFGERFFTTPGVAERMIELRALPAAPWSYTDDTIMAMSVVDTLEAVGAIDRDVLAGHFAARYQRDPGRGYGGTAHGILRAIAAGESWADAAGRVFDGTGSMGNGAAMRSAPVGAFFCDDFERTVAEARLSAQVTHAHPEGQAGAIAIAIAAAWTAHGGSKPAAMFEAVLDHTPHGATRAGIERAAELPLSYDVRTAVAALGNGTRIIAEDTVPFSLWCAARHIDSYQEALWTTVSGLGDRDTTCAIVGGIIAARADAQVPSEWLEAREPLAGMSRELLGR